MLSPAQIARYHEDGYVVPDFRVAPDVLESIKVRHVMSGISIDNNNY